MKRRQQKKGSVEVGADGLVPHIGGQIADIFARGVDTGVVLEVVHDDVGTFPGELLRGGLADPRIRTGDERHSSL
jgi:hypothetical protein